MHTRNALITLIAAAAIAAGCGDDEGGEGAAAKKQKPDAAVVDLAERRAQLEKDPYDVRCADIRDVRSNSNTRMVQYALADDAKIPGLNRLQASQSIFFALTELCKSKPDAHQPAEAAIAAVRSGRYRAEL